MSKIEDDEHKQERPNEELASNTLLGDVLKLSPLRNTSKATNINELVDEQLLHFGVDPKTDFGQSMAMAAFNIIQCQSNIEELWRVSHQNLSACAVDDVLTQEQKIARFNAKKFLCFQIAKVLDTLQNPFRETYQNLGYSGDTLSAKGAYPIFDNVTALFSATPVIARTATYIYACAEWIEDAFKGKELLLEIYSRLLNPTSLSLANHIVDLEAGPYASEYLAWNYNSGMAAIDAALSHVLGHNDVMITSRNIYGGAHQLIHDWYAKPSNLNLGVEVFDGEGPEDFLKCWERVKIKYRDRFKKSYIDTYVYLESPSNPQGYVLDVPGICKAAHQEGLKVILDATVGTPFLVKPLRQIDEAERPDFVIHSYTKDLSGTGSVIAGCVIGKNEDMFIPKGMAGWDNTMFWNVYYVKGAFLNADAAYEVMQGMRTLESRMLSKCINTKILACFLASHPDITVNANCVEGNKNYDLREALLFLGLPAPLFTVDMKNIPRAAFQRFFDCLEPTFGHMISLGQTNTIVSCPGLTTHSELSEEQLKEAGICQTTIRFAVGTENPIDLLKHLRATAILAIDPLVPGYASYFPSEVDSRSLIETCYTQVHQQYIQDKLNRW